MKLTRTRQSSQTRLTRLASNRTMPASLRPTSSSHKPAPPKPLRPRHQTLNRLKRPPTSSPSECPRRTESFLGSPSSRREAQGRPPRRPARAPRFVSSKLPSSQPSKPRPHQPPANASNVPQQSAPRRPGKHRNQSAPFLKRFSLGSGDLDPQAIRLLATLTTTQSPSVTRMSRRRR